jgi:predicted nucleic-acid-binding protein
VTAIDTNVLVRLITRDDAQQVLAAERFITGGAWVSVLVLAETTWVLSSVYGRSNREIAALIDMLLDEADLVLENEHAVRHALTLYASRPGLGFSDCLILGLARQAGCLPLGTFDRTLAAMEGTERIA